MDYHERITIDQDMSAGKPCIRGKSTMVYDILGYRVSSMSEEEILAGVPYREAENVRTDVNFVDRIMSHEHY